MFWVALSLIGNEDNNCNSKCIGYTKLRDHFPNNEEIIEKCSDNSEGINFVCTNYAKKYCESRSKLCAGINGGTINGWNNYYHKCQKNGNINGFMCSFTPLEI